MLSLYSEVSWNIEFNRDQIELNMLKLQIGYMSLTKWSLTKGWYLTVYANIFANKKYCEIHEMPSSAANYLVLYTHIIFLYQFDKNSAANSDARIFFSKNRTTNSRSHGYF
jgi:hypothetical protein